MKRVLLFFVGVFFILTSCSKENIADSPGKELEALGEEISSAAFVKSNENLTSNFLPTFTNFYGRDPGTSTNRSSSLASEWIHEYDDNERLVKSSLYELFPYRILKEVTYSDIVEDHKLAYDIKVYDYYGLIHSFTESYELEFDDELRIRKIGGGLGMIFKELNDRGWVTQINTLSADGHIVYKTGYEYDESGNVLKYIAYDNPGIPSSTVHYTYNESGDPLSYHYQNTAGAEVDVKYYYREDNTLERLEEIYKYDADDRRTETYTYTPEERFLKKVSTRGDGSKKVVTYTEDEILVECSGEDGVLTEVSIYQIQNESSVIRIHKEYLHGKIHKIQYFDDHGDLEYTEYYDENGELVNTVYEE